MRGEPAPLTDPREALAGDDLAAASAARLPQVSQRRPLHDALVTLGGIAIVASIGALTLVNLRRPPPAAPPTAPAGAPAIAQSAPAPMPLIPPQAITTPALPAPVAPQSPAPPSAALAARAAPGVGSSYSAPVLVYDSRTANPIGPAGPATTASGTPGAGSDDFAARLGASGNGAASATAAFDPKTTVAQGTLIPAVLETAIDTDTPGYVRAIVSSDVRSFDGSRVLIPRTSRLVGQYRSGMQAGQRRVYVIWTRLIRPDGVSANLGSPAVGPSGESGIEGKVNTHFFERFGSALLLSVVAGLSNAVGGSGSAVVIASGGQSAAAAAVGQTGQIGPTVRVRQGEPIRVFTARDLDFSGGAPR